MVAIILATSLRTVLTHVVLVAQTLTTMAFAVARAVVWAHLDGAICSAPATIAIACAVVAMSVAEAVVQADARVAVIGLPPMFAAAKTCAAVALAMARAIIGAGMTPTILAHPSVSTPAFSGL